MNSGIGTFSLYVDVQRGPLGTQSQIDQKMIVRPGGTIPITPGGQATLSVRETFLPQKVFDPKTASEVNWSTEIEGDKTKPFTIEDNGMVGIEPYHYTPQYQEGQIGPVSLWVMTHQFKLTCDGLGAAQLVLAAKDAAGKILNQEKFQVVGVET